MPPKKKVKTAATIASDFDAAIALLKSTSTRPDKLSSDLLARAYGLAQPQDDSSSSHNLYRVCTNRWAHATGTNGAEDAPTKGKGREGEGGERNGDGPDVIVLDSADENDHIPPRKGAKGKGKAKQLDVDLPKPCAFENCDRNPRCLNWLGQDKWETDKKALKDFKKASGLTYDPENDRIDGVPVGLTNLGATCYANSFLQVWFRDPRFRSGVYSCLPPQNGNVKGSPVFQLQALFAFLQNSKQAVYDPSPLIESLRLDTTEQQDAQEFSKLFLQVLDAEFKKQGKRAEQEGGDGKVERLVEELFEGKMSYATKCLNCQHVSARQTSFLEVEVNLKHQNNTKLEDRIKESLKPEVLKDDNQYFCEECDGKQDAHRYSTLDALPPVLHFSLMRFAFNYEKMERYKSSSSISYPLQLDMGKFLDADASTSTKKKPEVWYDLKGVLMHKGTSAHSGHYVAQVYDESQSKWFLFDDETVTPIDDLNAPTPHDEDDAPVVGKKRPATGFTRDANGVILPKSKDAYMLVYIRREASPDASTSSSPSPEPVPPPLAQAAVEELDKKYAKELEEYKVKSDGIVKKFHELREKKRSVYRVWDVQEEDEEAFLVDKAQLKRWVEDGLLKPKTKKEREEEAKAKKEAEAEAKGVNGMAKMENGLSSDVEIVDAEENGKEDEKEEKPIAPSTDDIEMVDGDPSSSAANAAQPNGTPPKPAPPDSDDLPSPSTVLRAPPAPEPMKVISNAAIRCEHGMLNPAKAEDMKRVSQMGVMALRDLGVTLEPELMAPRDFCRACVAGKAADLRYKSQHPEDVIDFDAADREGERKQVIPKSWHKDWHKNNPTMHVAGSFSDPTPSDEPWVSEIVCDHGLLDGDVSKRTYITSAAVKVLKTVFPDWKPLKLEPCEECGDKFAQEKLDSEGLKKLQTKEKRVLKTIEDAFQSRLIGTRLPIGSDDSAHWVVPHDWCYQWVQWMKPSNHGFKPQPGKVNNSQFMCGHDLLCLDLAREVEGKKIAVVSQKMWEYLVKQYDAGPPIRIWQEPHLDQPSSSPEVCFDCLAESRKMIDNGAQLQIKTLSAGDFDADGKRKPEAPSSPEVTSSRKGGAQVTYGSRSSTRLKDKTGVAFRKQLKYIDMEAGDCVKDLKRKIEEETKIPIITQRLFFNFQELDDSSLTVKELGLAKDDLLEVYGVKADDVDLDKLDGAHPKSRKRGRSEGFGGTGLLGFRDFDVVEETGIGGMDVDAPAAAKADDSNGHSVASSSTMEQGDGEGLTCDRCTFVNAVGMTECEMCMLALGQ
ncbi:hypothetical protein JCM10207_000918 [Rhodosporidiobolus poonsookiae]